MRGRPSEQVEIKTKWTEEYIEFPSKPELGTRSVWYYDVNKSNNGPFKTEINYPKGYKFEKLKPQKGKAYNKMPVVMAFKTSNRSNAKTKVKVWNNENIDYILTAPKLPGVPPNAVILDVGVGSSFIKSYAEKYDLA